MSYADLPDLLAADDTVSVTTFPDGSVDVYYTVSDRTGRVETRGDFGKYVGGGESKSLRIRQQAVEPGGQAVNMALQADALGDDVTLFGRLDDPVFDDLSFETYSMGDPATVDVYDFVDGDFMLSEEPDGVADWGLDALRDVGGDRFPAAFEADAVLGTNWVSYAAMTDSLRELAELDVDGDLFVFDAGDVTTTAASAVEDLLDALETLDGSYDVVLSANQAEVEYLASSLDVDAPTEADLVDRVRAAVGVTGVVLHDHPFATAATRETTITVPDVHVATPRRQTGAGDRFGAGLAHGLAADWGWEHSLLLGNLCAAYYVEHSATGTRSALAEYLESKQ